MLGKGRLTLGDLEGSYNIVGYGRIVWGDMRKT